MTSLSAEQLGIESKALCDLIKENDKAALTACLARSDLPSLANAKSSDGEYPLLVAAKRGHAVALSALLKAGADPNTHFAGPGTFAGYTPLHFAAGSNDTTSLAALVAVHADVNALSDEGWSPLHVAAYKGKHEALDWLLGHGAEVNAVTRTANQCPLLFAVSHGRPSDVRSLLQHGAKTSLVADQDGNTVFHQACAYPMSKLLDGQYDVPDVQLDVLVALLLRGETDPAQANHDGRVATFYLAAKLPSIQEFCACVFRCRTPLLTAKHEWNYMSLVSAKVSAFTSAGVPSADAESLSQLARAVEEERLLASMRVTKPPVQAVPPTHASVNLDTSVDPSGGKCPFFQRGQTEKPAVAGTPGAAGYQFDPSGGKCPFFKGLPADRTRAEASAGPFPLVYVRRHATQLTVMTTCFLLGVAADRLLIALRSSK